MNIYIYLTVVIISIMVIFFHYQKSKNVIFIESQNEKKEIFLEYATSSINSSSNNYIDYKYGLSFVYPKEMAVKIIEEENQFNILRVLYVKPISEIASDRNSMYISIVNGNIDYIFNYYNMSSYEDFSSSTININSLEGVKVNYRDGFSGEIQNDILLNLDEKYVLHISYSRNKSNDVEKFEPNMVLDSILSSIKLIK